MLLGKTPVLVLTYNGIMNKTLKVGDDLVFPGTIYEWIYIIII